MFPIWAIVVVVIVVIAVATATVIFMKRRRSRSLSVDTLHKVNSKANSMSSVSFQTLVAQKQRDSQSKHASSSSLTPSLPPPLPPPSTFLNTPQAPQLNEKTDRAASVIDESDAEESPSPVIQQEQQEIRISLPLPPPSTSFFSDKMELDGGQDLFDMYINSKKEEGEAYVSIDLDAPTSTFYSNVQQKAATIKSTLRQSLRIKQQKSNRDSLQQLFQSEQLQQQQQQQPIIAVKNEDSAKVIIDMDIPTQVTVPQIDTKKQKSNASEEDDESPTTPNTAANLQEPVRAAKRIIRTASKKSKRRSMAVNDFDINEHDINGNISRHGSLRFHSVRGNKNNSTDEHMTITSGSMRRLVRESILFDDGATPLPSSANLQGTASSVSAAKKNAISAVDIASWWDTTPKSSKPAVATDYNSNDTPPLNVTSGSESTSSKTPNQYRASLSTSIFAGTLSRATGSSTSLFADTREDGSLSRHGSFRKGTLGRNTLRSITANGVNKSLKGLFDHSSSTSLSNKVVPDDSQKMELDFSNAVTQPASKNDKPIVVEQQQQQQFNSIRKKSIRASTSNGRPSLPVFNMTTSESSTKYALSDDEESQLISEKSSLKPVVNHQVQPESPTLPPTINDESSKKTSIASSKAPESINTVNTSLSSVHQGEVDTIRRMLQDTWASNMKESGSNYSVASEVESLGTTSTQSTISSRPNPHHQQSLLSKSLLTQQVAKRASLLARHNGEDEFIPQQAPEPSASFSSSTVRTMVPTSEASAEPIAIRQNAINSKIQLSGSNKIQESSYDSKSHLFASQFSTSPMTDISSPRNTSADSSRGHSRKSSGGNSAATALRISSGYSANAKTWNGRAQKRSSKPSVSQEDFTPPTSSIGRSSINNKKFFSTMRKGQKNRGNIPWMMEEDAVSSEKTPAQIERDRYLEARP